MRLRAIGLALMIAACTSTGAPPATEPDTGAEPPVVEPAPPGATGETPPPSPPSPEDDDELVFGAEAMPLPTQPTSRSFGTPTVPEVPIEEVATEPTNCALFAAEMERAGKKITCVSVLYGTNRTVSDDRPEVIQSDRSDRRQRYYDQGDLFSIRPDSRENCEPNALAWSNTPTGFDVCHLGEIFISVPAKRDEKLDRGGGTYQQASSGSEITARSASRYFTLFDHRSFDGEYGKFQARVRAILQDADKAEGHAFVFIHGFNVPFRNAAFRTAQLKYDMDFDGPAFFFSWPSNGSLLDYLSDQEDADLSVDALVRFLRFTHDSVNSGEKPVKLHIIAHSMGTRVTAQALARLSDFPDSPHFGHVVFAAGDLDTNLFAEWMGASSRLYEGVTIYTSRQDKAVNFSSWLRNLSSKLSFWGVHNDKKRRIGFYEKRSSPTVFNFPAREDGRSFAKTIDISYAAASSFLFKVRHSVYAESKVITDDIRFLFDNPFAPPSERSENYRILCEGDLHWTYATPREARRHRCPAMR